jgi:hypothetical protein
MVSSRDRAGGVFASARFDERADTGEQAKEIAEAHKKHDEEKANQAQVQPSGDKSSPGRSNPTE